jgi:inositol-hexakisphosphate/diphosphoinositol-pentakisphosphate 1-kinase
MPNQKERPDIVY